MRGILWVMEGDFNIYTGRYGSSVGQVCGRKLPFLQSCKRVFIETISSRLYQTNICGPPVRTHCDMKNICRFPNAFWSCFRGELGVRAILTGGGGHATDARLINAGDRILQRSVRGVVLNLRRENFSFHLCYFFISRRIHNFERALRISHLVLKFLV